MSGFSAGFSGTRTHHYNEADPPNGAYGVIRGRVRRLGEELQEDSLICGVYDCILQR